MPATEFRAAWIATVDNIDWPSRPGLPAPQAQRELAAIVDQAAALHLDALVFQVRPAGDALYESPIEPWSEWLTGAQGRAPDAAWDPLQFLIERAHPRGIEVHAWFNPFRARHQNARSPDDARHVTSKLPDACVRYGKYVWMDPGDERAVTWTLRVIADVVRRYDVDGVHVDDYFYPYPEQKLQFADDRSFQRYQRGGGQLARDDWRRANIDGFLQRLYAAVHKEKPCALVGISPFGIARPGMPRGISAGIDQYDQLYADVLGWLRQGRCDYLAPQLYWPIDQKAQSFAALLPWWAGQNPLHRHLWPGLNASRAAEAKPPWRSDELPQQVQMIRALGPDPGHLLFSARSLRGELAEQLQRAYPTPAVVPASPWLPGEPPAAPAARAERAPDGPRVRWVAQDDARKFVVQVQRGGRWHTFAVRGAGDGSLALPDDATAVAVRAQARNGLCGPARVCPLGP
jgi:uncharacterized lipoprotein YddW (UPF0748 family)